MYSRGKPSFELKESVHRIDLHSLQLLASIADTRSFTKTATILHITASAVSKRVAELESRMKVRLAIRTSGGVELTPAGMAVVRCASDITCRLSQMARDVGKTVTGQAGEVRIVANTTSVLLGLVEDLNRFREKYPSVKTFLAEAISADVVADVQAGRADIGVCAAEFAAGKLPSTPYKRTDLIVAVPDDHPLAQFQQVSFEHIKAYPNIGRPAGSALPGKQYAIELPMANVVASVQSFDAVVELVRNNMGIAILPRIALERRPMPGIRIIPLSEPWAAFQLVVCHDATLISSPAVMQVLNWLAPMDAAKSEWLTTRGEE